MTLPGCYSAGWERKAHECCGVRLHPFTLGHARVLYLAGSPFVTPGNDRVGPQDTMIAVCVCSRPEPPVFSDLANLLDSGFRLHAQDMGAEAKAFAAYVKYWTDTHPKFTEKARPARIPWPWMYATILITECGVTEREAWASTCADAFWKAAAIGVYNGNSEFASIDQLDTMAVMNAQEPANV